MSTLITIPTSLDEHSFEQVLAQLPSPEPDETLVFDARQCTFATAYGLPALLALARMRAGMPTLLLPQDRNTLHYWTSTGFIRFAEEVFAVQSAVSQTHSAGMDDVLFQLTPVDSSDEAHYVVDRIQERALRIFTHALRLESRAAKELAMSLADACKAIVEHTNHTGWAMMQACHFRKRMGGCPVAIIAVCDAGGRFSKTEPGTVEPWRDSWAGDIDGIGEYVTNVNGKLSMRTDTSRRCLVPPWNDDVPLLENLAPFPGAQLQMIIPGRMAA